MDRLPKKSIPANQGKKDESGMYLKEIGLKEPPKVEAPTPVILDAGKSIDDLLSIGLSAIQRAIGQIHADISNKTFDRETIQNLRDLMNMLKDLKKAEDDLLEGASTEQLEEALRNEALKK